MAFLFFCSVTTLLLLNGLLFSVFICFSCSCDSVTLLCLYSFVFIFCWFCINSSVSLSEALSNSGSFVSSEEFCLTITFSCFSFKCSTVFCFSFKCSDRYFLQPSCRSSLLFSGFGLSNDAPLSLFSIFFFIFFIFSFIIGLIVLFLHLFLHSKRQIVLLKLFLFVVYFPFFSLI